MNSMLRQVVLAVTGLVLLVGCASAGGTSSGAPAPRSGSRNVLTDSEIQGSMHNNPLDLIREKRPHWLRQRGDQNFDLRGGVDIYVDGMRRDPSVLSQMPLDEVAHIEFLSATDATHRFGTLEGNTAILLTTRRGR